MGKFTLTAQMSESRFKLPEAVSVGSGCLLIAGGSKRAEVYDPRIGAFLPVPGDMSEAWHFMTETCLKDGTVLLAGGYANNDQGTSNTWIYRP
jgi:hypothetical protein